MSEMDLLVDEARRPRRKLFFLIVDRGAAYDITARTQRAVRSFGTD